MTSLEVDVELLILILPAWVANATPAFLSKFVYFNHPIDFGKKFIDGRRMLGDGKTIEGFLSGILAGTLVGYLLNTYSFHDPYASFVLATGSMLGDSIGSFMKRRIGYKRGQHAWGLDELPFIVTALVFYHLFYDQIITIDNLQPLLFVLIITFIAHNIANIFFAWLASRFRLQ
ncbi:MAG: CDP-2,3-bis-(O-geranylgeranyl)-sn-glycerol synthase [Thermoprotei archaeon]|mgnify:CR=1 FL=1|nr:MAG: CDP-2,3-bis-(O-geranylgeranyl)-sn-glycerol synthase [Thermoprotei archaeon]